MKSRHYQPLCRVRVLLPVPLGSPYDYLDDGLNLMSGDLVEVPLGPRRVFGLVIGVGDGVIEEARLKPVLDRVDLPRLSPKLVEFVIWVAAYTIVPPGSVLRMVLSVPSAFRKPPKKRAFAINLPSLEEKINMTAARSRVLKFMTDSPARPISEIAREAEVSSAVVKGLYKLGLLEQKFIPTYVPPKAPDPFRPNRLHLNSDQRVAADILLSAARRAVFSVHVLDGITGSGKTEVYLEAIAEVLKAKRQVLVLVPEIALSATLLTRFEAKFGARPTEWHSELSSTLRRNTWRAVAEGKVSVVVGARSALFLPFPDLGLIVVDEEHDAAFKQIDGVAYQGRDMAIVRSRLSGIPSILVSATPSLETMINVQQGRYNLVQLKQRHGGATLPAVNTIDLRLDGPPVGEWLAPALVSEIENSIARREQALLFLNRRGYAPLILCRICGEKMECPNCSAWLVEHRLMRRLQCHHCGYNEGRREQCSECGASNSLVAIGPGVERLAEEVNQRFPSARIQIASSDTLTGPSSAGEFVRAVQSKEVDIIIGTQVVAKGHHFPFLTTVGVIDADLGQIGGDLRAAERTYQLLHQVAGRAGRAMWPGKVYLQTRQPDSSLMRALVNWDRDGFLLQEINSRKSAGMPPFGRLVAVIISSRDQGIANDLAKLVAASAPLFADTQVFGPAPAPLSLLRGRYRYRLLLKSGRDTNVQRIVREWLSPIKVPGTARIRIDVDPYGFA